MEGAQQTKFAIGITVAAAIVLAASFMPWAEVSGFGSGFDGALFGNLRLSFTMTAWNGNINLLGLKIPHWFVVLTAATAALLAWLKALEVWEAPAALPVGLSVYGILHALWIFVVLVGSGDGSVGIGTILTGLAFAGMLAIQVRQLTGPPATDPGVNVDSGTPGRSDQRES